MTTNKRPHPQAKEEFFTHLLPHEIGMLHATYDLARAVRPAAEHDALVEAFLLHARNLIEFFKDRPSCDFDPRMFTNASYQLDKEFVSDTALQRINAQIARLTTRRVSSDATRLAPRDWALIVRALDGEIKRFGDALSANYREKWTAGSPATPVAPTPGTGAQPTLLRRANYAPATRTARES